MCPVGEEIVYPVSPVGFGDANTPDPTDLGSSFYPFVLLLIQIFQIHATHDDGALISLEKSLSISSWNHSLLSLHLNGT